MRRRLVPRPILSVLLPIALAGASAALSSCFFDDGLSFPPHPKDLAAGDTVDLAAPRCDLGCFDLAFHPTDGAPPDVAMSMPADLASFDATPGDAKPCKGGYLNSVDPKACPVACSALVEPVTDEGATHVQFGSTVNYVHNPPASGNHWPWPAAWGVHSEVLPREWWVHNLEHQGIVLLYNCPYPGDAAVPGDLGGGWNDMGARIPNNCPKEIAQLTAFYNNHPVDNWWDMIFEVRMIVTADPLLPGRFAALAWDWSYVSNTLDVNAIQCFIDARYGHGPEEAP